MNLLVTWQLPEWLSFSSLVTGIITLIGFITALIKLRAANKSNEGNAEKQITLLDTMTEKMSGIQSFVSLVRELLTKIEDMSTSMVTALADNEASNLNLANFVLECFNLSNLSDENKAKLQLLCDQLFFKENSQLAEHLQASKAEAEKLLTEKTEQLGKLQALLEETQTKLDTVQSTIKKSRRV